MRDVKGDEKNEPKVVKNSLELQRHVLFFQQI